MNHVMIDLETLATSPDAVILQIGAVMFDCTGIHHQFDITVNPDQKDRAIDPRTVRWWMSQSSAARQAFLGHEQQNLESALRAFTGWIETFSPECVWSNGADFDIPIMLHAYRHTLQKSAPWKYSGHRCFRTARNLLPTVPWVAAETKHDAVQDARAQAQYLIDVHQARRMQIL